MNTVNSGVERRKPSWIDYSRASRAQKTLDARNDSFKMNAFGNTVVVKDYTVLRQVGAIGAEEVKSLLQNHAATVRPVGTRQTAPKAPKSFSVPKNYDDSPRILVPETPAPIMDWLKKVCCKVVDFFTLRTTRLANRLQDELEFQFGRAIGLTVRGALYEEQGDERSAWRARMNGDAEFELFAGKLKRFAELYSIDVTNPRAMEDLSKTFVKRFVNTIKSDQRTINRIYSMLPERLEKDSPVYKFSQDLLQDLPPDERENAICKKEIEYMLRAALEPFVTKTETKAKTVAKDSAEKKSAEPPGKSLLEQQMEEAKSFLAKTISEKQQLVRNICDDACKKFKVFEEAFKLTGTPLKSLNEFKFLSGSNFQQVIEEMEATIQEVIIKGRIVIEETLQERGTEEVLRELDKGNGNISHIDLKETNQQVSKLLEQSWATAEQVKNKASLDSAKEKIANNSPSTPPPLSVTSTINEMNDVIRQLSNARAELNSSIRDKMERFALMESLETKAQTPPDGVDAKVWKKACHLVSDFLVNGGAEIPKRLTDAQVNLLKEHAAYFSNNLPIPAKERLETIIAVKEESKKVDYSSGMEYHPLNLRDERTDKYWIYCRDETSKGMTHLNEQLNAILNPSEPTDLDKESAAILKKMFELNNFKFEKFEDLIPEEHVNSNEKIVFYWEGKPVAATQDRIMALMSCLDKAMNAIRGKLVNTHAGHIANASTAEQRTKLHAEASNQLKKATEPYIKALNALHDILITNTFVHIQETIQDCSWNGNVTRLETREHFYSLSRKVDRALSKKRGDNVEEVRKAAEDVLKLMQQEVSTRYVDPMSKFVGILSTYGKRGEMYEKQAMHDGIKMLDNLSLTFKRTADFQNLISNSIEAFPRTLDKLEELQKSEELKKSDILTSKWMGVNVSALRTMADQLRTDFAIYTKKVANYANLLREEGVWNVDSEQRSTAINEVKDALSICTASFMPMLRMVSELETHARESFQVYDKQSQAGAANDGLTPPLCTNLEFAETAAELHIALQNAFCSLSEISRGLLLENSQTAEADNLHLLKMEGIKEKVNKSTQKTLTENLERARGTQLNGNLAFAQRKGVPASEAEKIREIYQKGFGRESFSTRLTMMRNGGRSADLFSATENVTLAFAAEKRLSHVQSKVMNKGAFEAALGKVLEKLNDPGVAISGVEDLHKLLKQALPEISEAELQMLDSNGAASNLASNLIAFSRMVKTNDTALKNATDEVSKSLKEVSRRLEKAKSPLQPATIEALEKLIKERVAITGVDDLHKHLKNALPDKIFKSDIDKFKGDGAAGNFANELIAFSSQVKGYDILLENAAEEVRNNSFEGVVQRFTQRLAPETIKALEELMDERVKVEDETDLHTHLKRKLPKISDDELKKLTAGGAASDLVNKWISLSSKQRAYGIQDQGVAMREYVAQEMSKDVKDKGYKVVWVNATQSDQISRAILEDKGGNRVFYSLKSDGKTVTFMPERNSQSSFKEFTVAIKE